MVTIANWRLQRTSVLWKSSDDAVHLSRHERGWIISVFDDEQLQLLQQAGIANIVMPVSFNDAKQIVVNILDCSSSFVHCYPSYRVIDTPYTLIRHHNKQWTFKYQSLSSLNMLRDPVWKYVNQRLKVSPKPQEFATREAALEYLNQLIDRFHQLD